MKTLNIVIVLGMLGIHLSILAIVFHQPTLALTLTATAQTSQLLGFHVASLVTQPPEEASIALSNDQKILNETKAEIHQDADVELAKITDQSLIASDELVKTLDPFVTTPVNKTEKMPSKAVANTSKKRAKSSQKVISQQKKRDVKAERTKHTAASKEKSTQGKNQLGTEEHVGLVNINQVHVLKQVKPIYPRISERLGESGLVILSLNVNQQGIPNDIKVMKSSGYQRLDEAALKAGRAFRFKPYRVNDRAVAMRVNIPIEFKR